MRATIGSISVGTLDPARASALLCEVAASVGWLSAFARTGGKQLFVMRSSALLALLIVGSALGFVLLPPVYYVPYTAALLVVAAAIGASMYRRRPRIERFELEPLRQSITPRASIAATDADLAETVEISGQRYGRVRFSVTPQVPLAFTVRRRRNPIVDERIVRNTLIENIDFEYELRPIKVGNQSTDNKLQIGANYRFFMRDFLVGEPYERLFGFFASQHYYAIEVYCNGEELGILLQPELDELHNTQLNQLLEELGEFRELLNLSIQANLHRFIEP